MSKQAARLRDEKGSNLNHKQLIEHNLLRFPDKKKDPFEILLQVNKSKDPEE